MSFLATPQQEEIINAPLGPLCVVACPGSGKTTTAVRRLVEVRKQLGDASGYVALLSYSNVAVETFRKEFNLLAPTQQRLSKRVLIETVDSFFCTNVVRPHGAQIMGTSRSPYLVTGSEPFLANYQVWHDGRPYSIDDLSVEIHESGLAYYLQVRNARVLIDRGAAEKALLGLAKQGAYTHELGRYWALKTLAEQERLLGILSKRYPHVLIDECQDVGSMHEALLDLLSESGTCLTLIGDPHQSIYSFAGADGTFMSRYAKTDGVRSLPLSQNRRSIPSIVTVANNLSGADSVPFRMPAARTHGAFYIRYDEAQVGQLMNAFSSILQDHGYSMDDAAVVCRGNSMVDKVMSGGSATGQGATAQFAFAAIERDRNGDIANSFACCANGILKLIDKPASTLRRDLLSSNCDEQTKRLKYLLWEFLRSESEGLPSALLSAKKEWQPKLKQRLKLLLERVSAETSFQISPSWTHNVTVTELDDAPLWKKDFAEKDWSSIRVGSVHSVKGESIPVVLYLARTADITQMLRGTGTEGGRIGYVAVTRAKDLLLIAVPSAASKGTITALEAKGFLDWNIATAPIVIAA